MKKSESLRYLKIIFSLSKTLFQFFLLINIENILSLLLVSFLFFLVTPGS